VNNVDTLWGAQSEAATRKFQSDYGLEVDGIFGVATEKRIKEVVGNDEQAITWDDIKYFDRSEFACKCGKYCNGFPYEMNMKLVKVADRVRSHFGAPVIVSSGVRCKTHNANVGGVPNSRHLYGNAMDFCVKGKKASEVLAYVQKQPEIRYSYAIDSNYVHMDIE
jgi:hypothetical protein